MPQHRVISGVVVTTPEGVFEHYRPAVHMVPDEVWAAVRPLAVQACAAADYRSVAAALSCMSAVTHFLAWAHREDLPMLAEAVFTPSLVERYCLTRLTGLASETRSTRRGYLRRVGRACTRRAPWPRDPKPFAENVTLLPPYTPAEVEGFWEAAEAQGTDQRVRVCTTILTLGLGAGLKPGEMLTVCASDVFQHPDEPRLLVIVLPDRTVPVLAEYTENIRDLCRQYPRGPLIGPHRPTTKDPFGGLRKYLTFPNWLPAFRPTRLRTTWMATVLSHDVRISEFMLMAGTVSAKTLETIAPYVLYRADADEYLVKGAGL